MDVLSISEMEALEGGRWQTAVDYVCAIGGTAGVFVPALWGVTAVCAGWALGRLL